MQRISLDNISQSIFAVAAADVADKSKARADIVAEGRLLMAEYAKKGKRAVSIAQGKAADTSDNVLTASAYRELNQQFQQEHLLYAATRFCDFSGEAAPSNFDEFRAQSMRYYGNASFYAILQGIYQEIITPLMPAVYSEAVDIFADVIEVGFGETATVSVTSNDIPIFQDSSWGASRSVPRNRFYAKDYTLAPSPRTAQITAKWMQIVGNGMDFGRFFANLTAGMYAKTMGMWNAAMTAAASDTTLIPSGLTFTFNNANWVTAANKVSAVNSTPISNVFAFGSAVALSKVLPTNVTGSSNVNMDAAIATLLGADYTRAGYLGEFMSVRLVPLIDAVVPGTQNNGVTTVLNPNNIWMMAGNARKPMTIAYNSNTPITIEMDPTRTADFEIGINMTISLDMVAVFADKLALITVS